MTNENISIEEFEGKKYQITLIEPYDTALLTHYLHNYKNSVAKHYKNDAMKVFENFIQHIEAQEQTFVQAKTVLDKLLFEVENVPFPTHKKTTFEFIDLFAGIGGFRLAMQNVGGKCVFTSEWDISAKKTYRTNFGEVPFGDITKEKVKNFIPEKFDILCAGFPCQAFSIAGHQKGFTETRGTLFFDIEQI